MKIVRFFTDYYDGAAGQAYSDDDVTFIRKPVEYEAEYTGNIKCDSWLLPMFRCVERQYLDHAKVICVKDTVRVLFCGKLYTGVVLSVLNEDKREGLSRLALGSRSITKDNSETFYAWSSEAFQKNIVPRIEKKRQSLKYRDGRDYTKADLDRLMWLLDNPLTDLEEASVMNRVAVASCTRITSPYGTLTVNAPLKDLGFQQRFPPQQAYQELQMWLGNLANPEVEPSPMSNKEKVDSHGFDKWSFRKKGPNSV